MTGRIHSFQSLGTVDGPGVRCVVFMQGCPLRCACCHNPDTWDFSGGEETDTDALVRRIMRFESYFGASGGVTLSGGEPLMQAGFCAELFRRLHERGVHTALDTSGCVMNAAVSELLEHTDLVLLDHKYADAEAYYRYTKCEMADAEAFLDELERRHIPTWLRRVIIPGLTDTAESALQLKAAASSHSCVEKVELLPFRKLCTEKYKALGIAFPLEDTPEPDGETVARLNAIING